MKLFQLVVKVVVVFFICYNCSFSQTDSVITSLPNFFYCPDLADPNPCSSIYPYFPTDGDTLKVLVVFCNFPNGTFEASGVYTQDWPASIYDEKPPWADSIICPTTTNVWDRSLTGLFRDASGGKFWLIGDVYPDLYLFEHNIDYYSPANGRRIGDAVKELLINIDGHVDFSDYDKYDPSDIDEDNNRREPDGIVDFIFINFRFNNSKIIDPNCYPCSSPKGYSGIAKLGGRYSTFGGDAYLNLDGVKIYACFPSSGALYEMWTPWHIGVPAHEFGEHYTYGAGHSSGLGAFNLQGGLLASARDREKLSWNFGIQYYPNSDTSITLRDYITQGDYIKIPREQANPLNPDDTLYIENRRRISYYASESYKDWHWYSTEPRYPIHPDSGILIYKKTNDREFVTESANGKWNWQKCSGLYYKSTWSSNSFNIFYQDDLNRFSGQSTFDLHDMLIKDPYCNTISEVTGTVHYRGVGGDSNTCFDVDYNDVYSPWSNPPLSIESTTDSLTIEIAGRDENGDMIVNIYFTNITDAKPSKPQYLRITPQYIGITETHFHPKLDWSANLEPDLQYYKVYRGQITTSGVDPSYSYIGTSSTNSYVDSTVDLYTVQSGSGPCTYLYTAYSYRITAFDNTSKESVKSERDTTWGYVDPCEENDNIIGNSGQNPLEFSMSQNYPNPFNPITIINFQVKESAFVKLKVYNILGQEVSTLVNTVLDKGSYDIAFDANNKNLSSGIYYYEIEITNGSKTLYSDVKRMVLIK